jgi:hypothetical protein
VTPALSIARGSMKNVDPALLDRVDALAGDGQLGKERVGRGGIDQRRTSILPVCVYERPLAVPVADMRTK